MIWKILLIVLALLVFLFAAIGIWVFGIFFFGNDKNEE